MAETPTTAAPAPEMVNVTINGTKVRVPKGINVIEASRYVGVFIPHYCYHPKLAVAGNCRMCMVEIGEAMFTPDRQPVLEPNGKQKIVMQPRLAIGCNTPVKEGMVVVTNSAAVTQSQNAVLEFLLINHPLDCPICDQAGECKLQEYSVEFGAGASRFREEKVRKLKKVDLGPRVVLDDERCVLCSRCIRFMRDIAKDDCLGIVERGSHSTLACWPGKKLDSNYSLNTVDLCPVGALTDKDFRFKMRTWFLRETKSVCTSCATGCNTIIWSRENVVYRQTPRSNDAVNECWMCDAGRLNYKFINDAGRLTKAIVAPASLPAGSGKANDAGKDAGATNYADALKQLGPKLRAALANRDTVAFIGSARATNEELYLFAKLAKGSVSDCVPRLWATDGFLVKADRNPNSAGAKLLGVAAEPMGSKLAAIADGIKSGKIKTLVVHQEDVTKHGIGADLLAKLSLLLVIDYKQTATTKAAHFVLPGVTFAEKRGTFTNAKGRVQRVWPAVSLGGEARPEWEIFRDLLRELGGVDNHPDIAALFADMAGNVPAFAGLTLAKVGDEGVQISVS
ncbi:MAG: molybdopterin-dependent oxidoreductase [Verrucomicrobiia bacterium]|jgi:NADH-quinone oxidoreductase subunit G